MIINKLLKLFLMLTFFINISCNTFGQHSMRMKTFVFYSEFLDSTKFIQLEQIIYKYNKDTLFIIPFCTPDTTVNKNYFSINQCSGVYLDKRKAKTKIYFAIPHRYRKANIIIINYEGCNYYLKIGRRKKIFHLYKLES